MSVTSRKWWWLPGCAAGFFAVGISYWQIPYSKLNLPDAIWGAGLIVVVAAAALTRIYSGRGLLRTALVTGTSVPAVVMVRVVVDGVRDPTSHNLWPFELLIAVIVGGAAALAGAAIGSVVCRLLNREASQETENAGPQ